MELVFSIGSLIGIWFLVVTIAGPNFVAVTQYSMAESRIDGLFIALGVSTGAGIWATASLLGLGVLFAHLPWLYGTIRLVGGLYLMFIGFKIIRATFNISLSVLLKSQLPVSKYAAFRRGLLTSFSNPKTAAFFGSLFVATIPPLAPVWVYVFTIALIVCVSVIWYGLVAFFFSVEKVQSLYHGSKRFFDGVTGSVLLFLEARLAFSKS
ncbi:MAG: LysE family transporter [Deltaproteobacteria bacterium]|jgi:threonine/homoserine/homoserine lactone efflux protein|nr:LysE family transporter [Deltaproteobacteria bacterium]